MAEKRPPIVHVDRDGVRIEREPGVRAGVWVAVAALALIAAAVLLGLRPGSRGPADVDRTVTAPVGAQRELAADGATATARAPVAARPIPRRRPERDAKTAAAPDRAAADPGGAADADESDQPSGIALFPPPGTDPPKPGIIVPEDFALPPGFVRHYQATDDGQRLPAILMFHPDYEWVDEGGNPLPLPADRIVPPEMAPPGLTVRMLEVPDTHVPFVEPPAEDVGP